MTTHERRLRFGASCRTARMVLGTVLVLADGAWAASPSNTTNTPTAYPACYVEATEGGERFKNPAYFHLFVGEGLASANPATLFARISAATQNGELYKALYLSRLLARLTPNRPAVWTNSATIAEALGLTREAAAYRGRSTNTSDSQPVPSDLLPGMPMKSRPRSLADWAGAAALMADALAVAEGEGALATVKDSVSGVQALSRSTPDGESSAYARPAPIKLDDALTNAFSLRDARAMSQKGIGFGSLVLGVASGYLAASASANPVADANALMQLNQFSGEMLAKAFSVDSQLKKGSYVARSYPGGVARDTPSEPRSAGENEAVELPLPLFLASGGALRPAFVARLGDKEADHAKAFAGRFAPDDRPEKYLRKRASSGRQITTDERWKEYRIPDLAYPRLGLLYAAAKSEVDGQEVLGFGKVLGGSAVSTTELMLDRADIEALVPDAASRSALLADRPDTTEAIRLYASADPHLSIGPFNAMVDGRPGLVGFDASGTCYAFSSIQPKAWLMPVPRTKGGRP